MEEWREKYSVCSKLFKLVETKDVAKRVLKASRKYKKHIAISRYSLLLALLTGLSLGGVERLMLKIEKGKQ